jgi:hypothetical protein
VWRLEGTRVTRVLLAAGAKVQKKQNNTEVSVEQIYATDATTDILVEIEESAPGNAAVNRFTKRSLESICVKACQARSLFLDRRNLVQQHFFTSKFGVHIIENTMILHFVCVLRLEH